MHFMEAGVAVRRKNHGYQGLKMAHDISPVWSGSLDKRRGHAIAIHIVPNKAKAVLYPSLHPYDDYAWNPFDTRVIMAKAP